MSNTVYAIRVVQKMKWSKILPVCVFVSGGFICCMVTNGLQWKLYPIIGNSNPSLSLASRELTYHIAMGEHFMANKEILAYSFLWAVGMI
jgi:hypothetical protein